MPDEPRNTTGRTLRQQMRAAARTTAQQQRARNQAPSDSALSSAGKKAEKGSKGKSGGVTKRQASKAQKEQAKKQDKNSKEREKRSVAEALREGLLNMGLGMRIALGALALLIVAAAVLYPIGCTYYQTLRQEQRLQAELDAVNERNAQLEAENKALETDEGVENQAREEYGWVKDGEKATVVTNTDDEQQGDLPQQVDGSQIEPPHTWYYDILDIVFRADV
ncbi:MAG: septum formation initiator family protein [Coriobacteriales bacterium]